MPPKQLKAILSPLEPADSLRVVVLYHSTLVANYHTRLPWSVHVKCDNRAPWRHPGIRGGKTNTFFVGRCKTEEAAEKRAATVLRKLQRAAKGEPTP